MSCFKLLGTADRQYYWVL